MTTEPDIEKLREEIATLLGEQFGYSTIIDRQAYKAADAILALPAIADRLRLQPAQGQATRGSEAD